MSEEEESDSEGELACFFRRNAEESSSDDDDVEEEVASQEELFEFSLPGQAGVRPVVVVQERSKGIGFQLWPAATFLCDILFRLHAADATRVNSSLSASGEPINPVEDLTSSIQLPKPFSQCNVLELGAGVGLVGLFAANLGCKSVTLTDLQEVLSILHRNVEANPHVESPVAVRALAWGSDDWKHFVERSDGKPSQEGRGSPSAGGAAGKANGAAPAPSSTPSAEEGEQGGQEEEARVGEGLAAADKEKASTLLPPPPLPGCAPPNPSQPDALPTSPPLPPPTPTPTPFSVSSTRPDLILLADCVYWPELFAPLVDTLRRLCKDPEPPGGADDEGVDDEEEEKEGGSSGGGGGSSGGSGGDCGGSAERPWVKKPLEKGRGGATVLMAHTRRWKKDGVFFSMAAKHLEVVKIHEVVTMDATAATPGQRRSTSAITSTSTSSDRVEGASASDDVGGGEGEGDRGAIEDGGPFGDSNPRTIMRIYRIRAKPRAR